MLVSQGGKDHIPFFCFSSIQRPVCAEFCINTEGTPSSGTPEAEKGRKHIPWELFSKAAKGVLCSALLL